MNLQETHRAGCKAAAKVSFLTPVLVNTGSTLIQGANDEERVVGQRTWARRVRVLRKCDFLTSYFILAFILVLHGPI